ncbi:helix-turn-helix transcriptional regulator [Microlunatus kandeliicorticis]|uniref:helix-turn-helix transcriptional regulator n=1 Tax=Microlunatus kandeliicorticis TaxID=1759536 RepID=UPI0015F88C90|nr:helix-turn-helix domain-containing protein [Microlunatus kandeliicorticis]
MPGNRRTRTTETGSDAGHETDATTRQRVAQAILEAGPSSAAELAERLGLSAAGVRRHLDVLTERGLVEPRERRVYGARGRGRPAKVFALTDAGRADFFQAYDTLAIQALDLLAEQGGAEAIGRLGRRRLAALSRRFDRTGAADPDAAPAQRLADALTAEGYVASVRPAAAGEQLCQHHCPVAHVAERYPQLCEAETELFSELLGVHVQRLATIAHGDGVCTTHVPRTAAESTGPAERETEHEPQQDTRHDTQQGRQSI